MNKESRMGHCIRYSELTPQEKEDFIEPGIKSLVSALNSLKGVDTFASCEGHAPKDCRPNQVPNTAYVSFYCKHEEVLKQILIHFKDLSGYINFDRRSVIASQKMEISFFPEFHKEIVYTMRFKLNEFGPFHALLKSTAENISLINSKFKKSLDELPIAESGQ